MAIRGGRDWVRISVWLLVAISVGLYLYSSLFEGPTVSPTPIFGFVIVGIGIMVVIRFLGLAGPGRPMDTRSLMILLIIAAGIVAFLFKYPQLIPFDITPAKNQMTIYLPEWLR
jgi:hypothetical protein